MTYMDEKHEKIKCLTEELEKARFEAAMQADRAICMEKENEELRIGIENAQRAVEEIRRQLAYEEGRAEAYMHCINAMNGITSEKKVGFRSADG